MVVSARTGDGLDDLLGRASRPRCRSGTARSAPWCRTCRGDLVARAHQEGEVLALRHGAAGTELTARVPPGLAAEIDRIAVPATS